MHANYTLKGGFSAKAENKGIPKGHPIIQALKGGFSAKAENKGIFSNNLSYI